MLIIFRKDHRRCSVKKGVLKKFANFIGKHLCWSQFLIKLQALEPATLLKINSSTDTSCAICGIFKNTYLGEHLQTTASRYFQYNSHHHYHYHHFQYHRKMHLYLYRLKIFLTIPLECNRIPCLFQLDFVFFLPLIFFSSLIPSFPFFTPSRRTQNLP